MVKKKDGRPSWFKMFLHQKALIDSVSDETAGKALKAAFRYFDNEEIAELDPLAFAVFSAIKPYIDESFADFQATSEKNKENIKKRWANRGIPNDTTCTTGNHSIPNIPNDTKNTEAEAEADAEAKTEKMQKYYKVYKEKQWSFPLRENPVHPCQTDWRIL